MGIPGCSSLSSATLYLALPLGFSGLSMMLVFTNAPVLPQSSELLILVVIRVDLRKK